MAEKHSQLILIVNNQCAYSCHFERSEAESRNLLFNRFLHFGLLRNPMVEMTKAQIPSTIGIKCSLAVQAVKDVYGEISGTLYSIFSKPKNIMLKTTLAALAISVGTITEAWANSRYDRTQNPFANITSGESYTFDPNDPNQVLTAYNGQLCPVQKIENTPVKRVSFYYPPDYQIDSLVVGNNLIFIPKCNENEGRTDSIGYSVMGLTKSIELPDGSRAAPYTDHLKSVELTPETHAESDQRRYTKNLEVLDKLTNGGYVWAAGEHAGETVSISDPNLVPHKVYIRGIDFAEPNNLPENPPTEMTLEQAIDSYGNALSEEGACFWVTDPNDTGLIYAKTLADIADVNLYEPNCPCDSNSDYIGHVYPNNFSYLDGIARIAIDWIEPKSSSGQEYLPTWKGLNCFLDNEFELNKLGDLETWNLDYNDISFRLSRIGDERAIRAYKDALNDPKGLEIIITEPSESNNNSASVILQMVKKAQLEASYSNLRRNELPRPPGVPEGANWWYYNIILKEIGGNVGATIQKRQMCFSSPQYQNGEPWCDPKKTDMADVYGTNYIPSGGEIVKKDACLWLYPGYTATAVQTFSGGDNNGNEIETIYSFTIISD